jgi:hypothetical protein
MKNRNAILLAILSIMLVIAFQVPSFAEERFGPWVYYAPYYYPPSNQCLACITSPLAFLPRYESPNPPIPSNDPGPQCPHRPICKVKPKPGHYAASMSRRHYPVYRPRPSRMPRAQREPAPISSYQPLNGNRSFQQPQSLSSAPETIRPALPPQQMNRRMYRGQPGM